MKAKAREKLVIWRDEEEGVELKDNNLPFPREWTNCNVVGREKNLMEQI